MHLPNICPKSESVLYLLILFIIFNVTEKKQNKTNEKKKQPHSTTFEWLTLKKLN